MLARSTTALQKMNMMKKKRLEIRFLCCNQGSFTSCIIPALDILLLCCIHAVAHTFGANPCPVSYPTCGGPAEQRLGADGRARRLVQELLDMQHLPATLVPVSQNASLCITAQVHLDCIVWLHQQVPEPGARL